MMRRKREKKQTDPTPPRTTRRTRRSSAKLQEDTPMSDNDLDTGCASAESEKVDEETANTVEQTQLNVEKLNHSEQNDKEIPYTLHTIEENSENNVLEVCANPASDVQALNEVVEQDSIPKSDTYVQDSPPAQKQQEINENAKTPELATSQETADQPPLPPDEHTGGKVLDVPAKNEEEPSSVSPPQDSNMESAQLPAEMAAEKQKQAAPVEHKVEAVATEPKRTRKRKWLSNKKTVEKQCAVMSISTDSLKNLIADVKPVPLSDVKLDSSSDVEELASEDKSNHVESADEVKFMGTTKRQNSERETYIVVRDEPADAKPPVRPPSPSKNKSSSVLYITNLVRPFTVLQLKGLLARTGKIVEGGFWIDRIKSKCYVQYETDDEAIETRHALHGIRWPTSNPKCLNVDFGSYDEMKRMIANTKDETQNTVQDSIKDNFTLGVTFGVRNEVSKTRPIREWDVGKSNGANGEKRHEDIKEKNSERKDYVVTVNNDAAKNDKKHRVPRSSSNSPQRKSVRKEKDPPIRLLDDLFRKTVSTPCIYWLPLTPEQIYEKELQRTKRAEEQKRRIQQREAEREKAADSERERYRSRNREREKEKRSDRSNDRRSRSRERRRY